MKLFKKLFTLLALAAMLPLAAAQGYPSRPVKLVVPFPPGSGTDIVARVIADELRKVFGQSFVVENMAGADGIVAAQAVKRAPADGYTLLVSTNSAHGINPWLYNTLPYDPEKDFDPVSLFETNPLLLVVSKDSPANDVAGLLALARERGEAKPLIFGNGNTSTRVAAEQLRVSGKLPAITNVPYRGTPQAMTDLVGGQIDVYFPDPLSAAPFVSSGQVKVLAVTSATRMGYLPNVPTTAEVGHAGVDVVSFVALFAPAKTDPAIVERLNREISTIVGGPAAKDLFHRMGATASTMTSAEMRNFIHNEIQRWGARIKMAGIERNK